jgi:dUTP pyrophosphatase
MTTIKIKKISNDAILPQQGKPYSAGFDLFAKIDQPIELKPGQFQLIPTGIAIQLPRGYEAQVRPRSGLAINHGITVLNSPGTVDYGYLNEIKVILINLGQETFIVENGMRIGQLVIKELSEFEFEYVDEFDEGFNRGGGFGSSGGY